MRKAFESWRLFWALSLATGTAICLGLPFGDFHSISGMEFDIRHSVRCALPCFLVAFTASSLAILWPSRGTRWLLSNRRYFGLAFAFGMGCHLMLVGYATLLFGSRLSFTALALDVIGISFLLVLTLTSFRSIARHLSIETWRRLHKTGVYAIWLLATDIYLGNFRSTHDLLHGAILSVLLAAWLLRVAAWIKQTLVLPARASSSAAMKRNSISKDTRAPGV